MTLWVGGRGSGSGKVCRATRYPRSSGRSGSLRATRNREGCGESIITPALIPPQKPIRRAQQEGETSS
ncbi:hypothetical protein ASPFODRAFT_48137 [Aspergillus luchuensis CBS 106.47]|uniref:Uncharacterized protein n=1 Tax=Aspergillus luchuensis (strain CBS 106.47) TaxID=1137211 RepID=A0A1M3TBQ2_ASPLC|nr:hypothetical protein ASPFODRAFT_48137 [Aspergillus luchuensis CBS 106.47]